MPGSVDMQTVEADAERTWAADAAIRAEFGSKGTYVAYRRAAAQGRVRILSANTKAAEARGLVGGSSAASGQSAAGPTLAERQAQVRSENVGRQFAGLPPLPIPQE